MFVVLRQAFVMNTFLVTLTGNTMVGHTYSFCIELNYKKRLTEYLILKSCCFFSVYFYVYKRHVNEYSMKCFKCLTCLDLFYLFRKGLWFTRGWGVEISGSHLFFSQKKRGVHKGQFLRGGHLFCLTGGHFYQGGGYEFLWLRQGRFAKYYSLKFWITPHHPPAKLWPVP